MIKVLVVVDHAVGISGPHRNVVGSLNALSERSDVDLRLLTGKIDENEPYTSRCDIQLGFEPHNIRKVPQNLWLLRRAATDRDIIYVPTGLKSFLYAYLLKGKRKLVAGPNVTPLPFSSNDHPTRFELKYMSNLWLEASYVRRDHVINKTNYNSVITIHHAIDTEKFTPQNRNVDIWNAYGIPLDGLKVLYVGHDKTLRKGVEVLLRSIETFNQENSTKVSFVFAGSLSQSNLNKVEELDDTYTLGFLNSAQLPEVMASADIIVIPSSWENFPFSVLESMSSGLPIIAGKVGGIPEQIIDGESGILLDIAKNGQHSSNAHILLADAITNLLLDPGKRRKLGEKARERILQHFTEERLGDIYRRKTWLQGSRILLIITTCALADRKVNT